MRPIRQIKTTIKKSVEYVKHPNKTIVNTTYNINKIYLLTNNLKNNVSQNKQQEHKYLHDEEDEYYNEITKKIQRNGGL